MLLAIDAGNSYVKLAYHDGAGWSERARVPLGEFAAFARQLVNKSAPDHIIISNVAAELFRVPMLVVMETWRCEALWLTARATGYGVTNAYVLPQQLGPDRWAALIAARHLCRTDALVVGVGTAVTIDLLTGEGTFAGGMILPGPELMRSCLAEKTQGIGETVGHYTNLPRSTEDAVYSGTMNAVAGAVEKSLVVMAEEADSVEVFMTGGGAPELVPKLSLPVKMVPDLVLEGLLHIAGEEGMK